MGRLLALLTKSMKKTLPVVDTLAYFEPSVVSKKNVFTTLVPKVLPCVVIVINILQSQLTTVNSLKK
jgi:hypothetical protein